MRFRVGHEVRFQTFVEAPSPQEAARLAEAMPYEEWEHSYLVSEDVVAVDESPVNPQGT